LRRFVPRPRCWPRFWPTSGHSSAHAAAHASAPAGASRWRYVFRTLTGSRMAKEGCEPGCVRPAAKGSQGATVGPTSAHPGGWRRRPSARRFRPAQT
jgi:hypothetical protein